MIDPTAPLPDVLYRALPGAQAVMNHRTTSDADRWKKLLADRGLSIPPTFAVNSGRFRISRAEVFTLGAGQPSPEAALPLLLVSMAWGLGLRAPRLKARLDAIERDPYGTAERLTEAWEPVRASADPKYAYRILTTERGAGRISMLGPAFATKFLYFAQGPEAHPNLLILDKVVATKLRPFAWPHSPTEGWWPETFASYCTLMDNWAREATDRAEHDVRPDEIEYTLFGS
jgi:hypothetical protein